MTGLFETYQDRKTELLQALIEHIQLSVLSLVIACVIAIRSVSICRATKSSVNGRSGSLQSSKRFLHSRYSV